MRCCDCGYSCHEKCTENVPKSCTKYKAVTDRTLTNQNANRTCGETASVNSSEPNKNLILPMMLEIIKTMIFSRYERNPSAIL